MNDITVCIAAHPARARNGMLDRAIESVWRQTLLPHRLIVQMDHNLEGGHVTHQKMLDGVNTEWVAFLDSDDEFEPEHLEKCLAYALEHEADYVYPWFTVVPGGLKADPFPQNFNRPWDDSEPICTTITILVRTSVALRAGFHSADADLALRTKGMMGEDYQFTLGCVAQGARIVHLPERTWLWHHHGANTSSNPNRGDARL